MSGIYHIRFWVFFFFLTLFFHLNSGKTGINGFANCSQNTALWDRARQLSLWEIQALLSNSYFQTAFGSHFLLKKKIYFICSVGDCYMQIRKLVWPDLLNLHMRTAAFGVL